MKKKIFSIGLFTIVTTIGLLSFTTTKSSKSTHQIETTSQSICTMIYTPGNYGSCLVEDPNLQLVINQMEILLSNEPPEVVAPTYQVYYNCETYEVYYWIRILN